MHIKYKLNSPLFYTEKVNRFVINQKFNIQNILGHVVFQKYIHTIGSIPTLSNFITEIKQQG